MTNIYGPKDKEHPSVGQICVICDKPFAEGDYTLLIAIRPADDEEAEKMKAGKEFTAESKEVHAYCPNSNEKPGWCDESQ